MNVFPRAMRVRGRESVGRLFVKGEGGFVYPFRYLVCVGEGEGVAVLVSVPKKYHKRANRRNVLKRRMREAFRTLSRELVATSAREGRRVEIALIYCSKESVEFNPVCDAVEKILGQIARKL